MHFWRKLESRITFRMYGCGCFDSSSNIESARTGSLHACWLGHFVIYSIEEEKCNWVRRYKPSYHCICGDQPEQKNSKKPTETGVGTRRKETQIGEGLNTLSYIWWGERMQLSERELCWVILQARLPEIKEANRNYNRCLRKETQIGEEPNTLSYIQFRRKEKEYFLRWTWAEKFKEAKRNKCRSKEIWI